MTFSDSSRGVTKMSEVVEALKTIHDHCAEHPLCKGCGVKKWCDSVDAYYDKYGKIPSPELWSGEDGSCM